MALDRYRKFIPVVHAIASISKDRSTKVGAIALGPEMEIRSTGYNGFPRGIDDNVDARHKRPTKYKWTAHAEENLVAQAARMGVSLVGCTVMVSALYPCANCARMMIQAGVARIVAISPDDNERWAEDAAVSREMFDEAGVELVVIHPVATEESQESTMAQAMRRVANHFGLSRMQLWTETTVADQVIESMIDADRDNAKLREMLAIAYAGAALYADDGELRDNRTTPFIDFKRDTVDAIDNAMRERTRRALAQLYPDAVREVLSGTAPKKPDPVAWEQRLHTQGDWTEKRLAYRAEPEGDDRHRFIESRPLVYAEDVTE